jgi:antitoxin VapB
MTILIRDDETDRIVRELATRTGETITDAVRKAASERLAKLPPKRGRVDWEALERVWAHVDTLPRSPDDLTPDEIIGYNAEGHFD